MISVKKNVKWKQNRGAQRENKRHHELKTGISLLVLVACWILWFVLDRGWIVAIGLIVAGDLTAEYLGEETFTNNSWLESLGIEHAGFSVWRVLAGVIVGVLILSLIIFGFC